jgi:cytochrome oxidase Cu insertion factor (SCO1/SenC/PrrC family)
VITAGAREGRRAAVRTPALLVVLVLAVLAGVGGGFAISRLRSSPAAATQAVVSTRYGLRGEATWAPGRRPAPAITLPDQSGRPFTLASLRGRTVAIAFFDSHCHQACPLEGRALAAAERALPAAHRPVLVVVSVNPLDTPASTRRAMRAWGLAGLTSWHWLRGDHRALAPVWRSYRIFVAPPANGDIAHTEAIYLLDRRGDERSAYLYPFLPAAVGGDLRALAIERRAA